MEVDDFVASPLKKSNFPAIAIPSRPPSGRVVNLSDNRDSSSIFSHAMHNLEKTMVMHI